MNHFFQTHVIHIFSLIRLNYIILIIFDFLNIKFIFHIIYLKQHIILMIQKKFFFFISNDPNKVLISLKQEILIFS